MCLKRVLRFVAKISGYLHVDKASRLYESAVQTWICGAPPALQPGGGGGGGGAAGGARELASLADYFDERFYPMSANPEDATATAAPAE